MFNLTTTKNLDYFVGMFSFGKSHDWRIKNKIIWMSGNSLMAYIRTVSRKSLSLLKRCIRSREYKACRTYGIWCLVQKLRKRLEDSERGGNCHAVFSSHYFSPGFQCLPTKENLQGMFKGHIHSLKHQYHFIIGVC